MLPPRQLCLIALALVLTATTIHTANPPAWWSDPATAILEPGATAHDYSPVTLGQLKHVATQAKAYLDIKLAAADGAGTQVTAICQFSQTANFSPVTLGQLKNVAKPFYDRLAAMRYNWNTGTYGIPNPLYPWSVTTGPANATIATIGQLKYVFAFELTPTFLAKDTDNDGLRDWHEYLVGSSITNVDSDGDGWNDLFEVQTGSNPILATSVPSESDDPDGDGLDNYWERALGLQPGNADSNGNGLGDGDEDADNDGVKNRLDAHPAKHLIAWPRVAENRYVVVPLENGFATFAGRNPKFWHLNDRGDVVGFADPPNPDALRPNYRVPIVWTNGAWTTLGQAGLLEVDNASRKDTDTMLPVRFYTREGGTEAPIQIDNERRIAAVAQLQDMVNSPNWGGNRLTSLIWQPVSGSVGPTPVPIGRNLTWQNNWSWNFKTVFDYNGILASLYSQGPQGIVLVNAAYAPAPDTATHRRFSPSPAPAYANLGERGMPLPYNEAVCRGSSIDGFVCGNLNIDSGPPYAVWTPSNVVHTFLHLPPHPSGMRLPLAIQRMLQAPGSLTPAPLVVLDGNGRLAVSTNWTQPIPLGITDSSGAAADLLDLAATTINTRGEILWPYMLPAQVPPRLWRNGRLHFVNNLLHTTTWTVSAVHHLNNHGVILATASSPASAAKPVLLLPVEVAVDANRNGEIEFGIDTTTSEKPYVFWVNHDRDIGHTVDWNDWEEDDVKGNETPETWDIFEPGLKWRRDLEDITRVWIDMKGLSSLINTHDANITLHARMEPINGNPEVTLFQPVEADGGRKYLTDDDTGYNQLQIYYGEELCTAVNTLQGSAVPRRAWENLASDQAVHLLFEGKWPGKGKLIFEFRKSGQILVSLPPVFLDLKKVEDMYETWTVGDVEEFGVDYEKWPAATATKTTGQNLPAPQTSQEKDYFLFVHGWNVSTFDKKAFADTAFKRLWHHGYKGRFGAFRWPTFWYPESSQPSTDNYDASEQRAWNSSSRLAALIAQLRTTYQVAGQSKIRLYAQSMGNVVASECLRHMAPSSNVHTYVSAQAALPAHVWDNTRPLMPLPGWALPRSTPNVYGYYWQAGATSQPHQWQSEGRPSYMAPAYVPTGVRYRNHYNPLDWALNFWSVNQIFKPNVGYNYGTTIMPPVLNQRFFKASGLGGLVITDLAFPHDRFEILSYAAESYSHATGQQGSTGGQFDPSQAVNLYNSPFSFGDQHKGHSAQYRSTIQKRWVYWTQVLDDMLISVP